MSSTASRSFIPGQVRSGERSILPTKEAKAAYVYGKYPHVLTGVIACGYCRDLGLSHNEAAMRQYRMQREGKRKDHDMIPALKCDGGYRDGDARRHPIFAIGEHRVAPYWDDYVTRLVRLPIDARHLAMWRAQTGGASEIAQLDQMEAAIRERRTLILIRLGNEWDEAVARQVRAGLRDLDADDQKLQAMKKQAHCRPAPVDETTLRNIVRRYGSIYESADPKTKNNLNRSLVGALGSMPSLKRLGELGRPDVTRGAEPIFMWPEIDAILDAS